MLPVIADLPAASNVRLSLISFGLLRKNPGPLSGSHLYVTGSFLMIFYHLKWDAKAEALRSYSSRFVFKRKHY